MTDIKPNLLGRYSKQEVDAIIEENRILEMRWQVFEDLYDRERQQSEKNRYALEENSKLRQQIDAMDSGMAEMRNRLDLQNEMLEDQNREIVKLEGIITGFIPVQEVPKTITEDGLIEFTTAVPNPSLASIINNTQL